MIIINLAVWESLGALREFVYKNAHHGVLRDRKRWFEKIDVPYYDIWRLGLCILIQKCVS
jgi:Domain of unknown function (DUF3291).